MAIRKFNITFDDGTGLLKSAVIYSDNMQMALDKFHSPDLVIGAVEINPKPRKKAITILVDIENNILLRNGSVEKIISIDDDFIETEIGKYNKECVKMK